jgi:hypothetical protein
MTSLPTKITKPRNKADIDYSLLKSELSDLIAERDQLVCVVILNIEAEYQLKIGWLEYDKFREAQKQLQHEESLRELEQDIQQLKATEQSD